MQARYLVLIGLIVCSLGLHACRFPTPTPPVPLPPTATNPPTPSPTPLGLFSLSIKLGKNNLAHGITQDTGGDVDTEPKQVGDHEGRFSGNGRPIVGSDNTVPDYYFQFNVDDSQLRAGNPTTHLRIEVDYYDQRTDTFSLQYDALPAAEFDGRFANGGTVTKTNSGEFKTAIFNLCDVNFDNRDNGADFRLSDNGDGAELISEVRVIGLPSGTSTVRVDEFGANPNDDNPDSEAIQSALDSTCSGETVIFTSGGDPGYQGYKIDQTLFLTGMSAKHDLTFTSSDPAQHALLAATSDLKGYVVRLYSRSRLAGDNPGLIDNIDFGQIDVDGGRNVRVCSGADRSSNGIGDNWGSWLPGECGAPGDPWCNPGNLAMDGLMDLNDVTQNYPGNPLNWTTGLVIHDLRDTQVECGSALTFGGAAGTIRNVTIDTAGDHVHVSGCAFTDADGDLEGWSDGITLMGVAQTVTDNTIINPSDVGIVYFGGKNTVISNNTVSVTAGNYGAFAGIALHPWQLGDVSGVQITGNQVTNQGDLHCGGIHAGINLGPQMWGGACVTNASAAVFGNSGTCLDEPPAAEVTACISANCQLWAYLPADGTLTLRDNSVSGAQINYLIEGVDLLGQFIDQNNLSQTPHITDWNAAHSGCGGVTWGAFAKVGHHPSLPGYTDLRIHCER